MYTTTRTATKEVGDNDWQRSVIFVSVQYVERDVITCLYNMYSRINVTAVLSMIQTVEKLKF